MTEEGLNMNGSTRKMLWSRMVMIALALSVGSATAYADEESGGTSDSGGAHPVDAIKKAGKEVGHGVKEGAVAVGHGVKEGAVAVGNGAKKVVHKVGHAIRRGVDKVEGKKTEEPSGDQG